MDSFSHFRGGYIYIYIPGTQMTSIFWRSTPQNMAKPQTKRRVIWVPGIYLCLEVEAAYIPLTSKHFLRFGMTGPRKTCLKHRSPQEVFAWMSRDWVWFPTGYRIPKVKVLTKDLRKKMKCLHPGSRWLASSGEGDSCHTQVIWLVSIWNT